MAKTTYVYCHKKKKMVVKGTEVGQYEASGGPMIIPPLKPFISPITGEEITCREQLRRHNRDHGVTNSQDYSAEFLEKRARERHARATGQDAQSTQERRELIKQAIYGR